MTRAHIIALLSFTAACGDSSGDCGDCPCFVEIVSGVLQSDPTSISGHLTVAELPAQLTFDQPDVEADLLEYRWGLDLDVDEDGTADFQMALSYFRHGGAEAQSAGILEKTQEDLWQLDGGGGSVIGSVEASISATTITMTADRALSADLSTVTDNTAHTFATRYTDGTRHCSDEL